MDNQSEQTPGAVVGCVASVKGSRMIVRLHGPSSSRDRSSTTTTVGTFLAVSTANRRLVGMITEVTGNVEEGDGQIRSAAVDLIGELRDRSGSSPSFARGLSTYPSLGDETSVLVHAEIRSIFEMPASATIGIGHLYQDASIEARLDVNRLLQRHFAILGSTGVGKSSGVAVLLREILAARDDLRVFTIDCHNEYGRCFGELANVISPRSSRLPFWLFNFEEIVDVIFGGRGGSDEETEILAELIPLAKTRYLQYKSATERLALRRADRRLAGYTVDTPVPYLLQDLIALIDERMGKLENRALRMHHHRLTSRLEAISGDTRYEFMFGNANVGGDTMAELLSHLFRIDAQGKPITVMQIAGLPAEVTDAVVSVLCAWPSTSGCGATVPCRCSSSARRRTAMRRRTMPSRSGLPDARSHASPRKVASTGYTLAWSRKDPRNSILPSSRNARRSWPCGPPTSAIRRCFAPP